MQVALINAVVLTDSVWRNDLAVILDGPNIAALLPNENIPSHISRRDLGGLRLVPGFIDTQVNGGGGVLFNDTPTVEAIVTIGKAHRHFGTTGFLPTLISDDLDIVRKGVAAVDAAILAGVPGVLGIHIEGPFLNIERKGIHDPSKIRILDEEGFAAVTGLRHGQTLLTLAPECTTLDMIQRLAKAGVIIAAGHTNASYETTRAALDNGVTGFTHIFNAMSQLTARKPGAVGAALEDQASFCGLIVDGRHIDPVTMKLALRCKSLERFMLVTDAMPSVGMINKNFTLQGQDVTVKDGVCINIDGTLAGSDLDMAGAVRNAVHMLDISQADAIAMASQVPAAFLNLADRVGKIAPGMRADLVLLNNDGDVVETWISGLSSAN